MHAGDDLSTHSRTLKFCLDLCCTAKKKNQKKHKYTQFTGDDDSHLKSLFVQVIKGHKAGIKCVTFDSRGRTLCSGSSDGSVRIWRVMDGRCTHVLSEGEDKDTTVTCCTFNPREGGQVFLCSGRKDGDIVLWSLGENRAGAGPPSIGATKSGSVVRKLREGHKGRVRGCVFHTVSADLMCSFCQDSVVCVWSLAGGQCLQVIEAGIGQVLSVAFMTGTGHMLLACYVRDATKAKEENAMQRIAKGAFFFLASGSGGFLAYAPACVYMYVCFAHTSRVFFTRRKRKIL